MFDEVNCTYETRGVEESRFHFPPRQCAGTYRNNCAAILGQKKKGVSLLNYAVYFPNLSYSNSQIGNGAEKRPAQKYFEDSEVRDSEIEGNTYSWVRESNEMI